MHLKKLELQGFKSFADKTVLEFKPGITAVIGPNGSGKSNISDAIRWVLGEQSVKTLRGSKLEDVIFAGTQTRKSVSYAEVSITIDNQDGKLPVDYSEVTITRRIYRSGDSEFYINKNSCRLKNIVELFMDTGIGRDGYSIIGQGRIDEILSTKSEERRRIFEDAAGIVKYRARKEEAEKKLENTNTNLIRINDICQELENQLEPLRIQSEKATEFLETKDKLKAIEVGYFISNINKNKEKLNEVLTQIDELDNQSNDEENKLKSLQQKREEIRDNLNLITKNIDEFQNKMIEVQNNIEKFKSDISINKNKKENNESLINKYNEEIDLLNTKIQESKNEIEDRKTKKERLLNDRKKFLDELTSKEEKLKELSKTLDNDGKKVEDLKAKIMQNIDLKFEKMEIIKGLSSNFESLKSRVKQIDKEVFDNKVTKDGENLKKEDQEKEIKSIKKSKDDLEESLSKHTKLKEEYDEKVLNYENSIRKIFDELNNKESRYKFLVETENEFEGYIKAVKELMQKVQKDKEFGKNIYGTIASLIKVPEKYETAIEMAISGSIQNIVTETQEEAKRAIEYLKKENLGRASFLPISAVKGEKIKKDFSKEPGFIGVASDLISYDKKYEGVIFSLLGKTVVVDNIDNATEMAKKNKYSFRIVTIDGDIINVSGQMSGGSIQKKTTNILSRGREIEELKKIVEELRKEKEKIKKEYEDYKLSFENSLSENDKISSKYQEISILFATENAKLDEINNNIERITNKNNLLINEKENNETEIKKLEIDIKNLNDIINNCDLENENYQSEVDKYAANNINQQKEFDELNSDITDLKISVSSFDESKNSIEEILERIKIDIDNNVSSVDKKKQEIEKMCIDNKTLEDKNEEIYKNIENSISEINNLEKNISDIKDEREKINLNSIKLDEDIDSEYKTLDVLRENHNKLDIRKAKFEQDIDAITNKMWDEYETTPNTAKDYVEVNSSTNKEIEKYKNKLKDLGLVNLNAIDEYKAVGDRYEYIRNQKIDLEDSKMSLEKIISDMVELMKIQFTQNFEKINKNFSEVFVELFGGGRAELILSDTNNVLESGIEIEVQPPGKKLQNMMLLSGGERAFTAIALLFAILKLSPSPFCVLDEIEAALDDVNVYRFAEYLKKFSKNTQFLIITHRKGSMESANTIYGATMQEHGVTKLVSMKLDE